MATKLEAFNDRGKQDYLSGHDLEDAISLIAGRPEVIRDITNTSSKLINYLLSKFLSLLSTKQFLQALPSHLN